MCPVLSSALDCSFNFHEGGTLQNTSKTLQNLPSKEQKIRIYFGTSKFHHKLRAKRKKDREKEVFTLGIVLDACMNGKNSEISRNLLKKVELRSGHSVVCFPSCMLPLFSHVRSRLELMNRSLDKYMYNVMYSAKVLNTLLIQSTPE